MKTSDFEFELPDELIAQYPSTERGGSRLLVLERRSGRLLHSTVSELPSFLPDGALLVFNDSKVRKARVYGETEAGGKAEFLLVRKLPDGLWSCMAVKARKRVAGSSYRFPEGRVGTVVREEGDLRVLSFEPPLDEDWIERNGHIPLPPYVKREDAAFDAERYQTVLASNPGSVAAPTAGLHFTGPLLDSIRAKGCVIARVTLHVGLGTFLPVRTEEIEDHRMHEEEYTVTPETAAAFALARAEGRPVVAVGTTSVRTLESAWADGELRTGDGSTRIFIYPGYRFNAVDKLFTNFHTPGSTLLMLVSAFAGRERILAAYAEAVRERYRFFSYGDAMLIL
ncbi:MAG: tRNA preQ1(34) S-adenosylmethionine ribosyltransferase-isomerase QueA [Spirochaetales bacterium]|nr:tRNA preQ1(34) S-adenosylmethionine ribosyltransferase-isomerase QueA [Spirochaetales bacterium]